MYEVVVGNRQGLKALHRLVKGVQQAAHILRTPQVTTMRYLKNILAVWGAISGLLLLIAISFFSYKWQFGNKTQIGSATIADVRFVLNWSRLGGDGIKSVLNSYESSRSLTGDHLDAYEILTNGISVDDLQDQDVWRRGDNLDGVLEQGVELVSSFVRSDNLDWFPTDETIRSDQIYIYSWSILFHNRKATAAKIIFAKPSENKVYYASVKM